MVPNPAKDAVNTSDSCMKFHVRPGMDNWVGMYADMDAPGMNGSVAEWALIDFTGDDKTLVMMVYKERINECGMKVERSLNDGPTTNLYVPNTKIDEWELMTFEMPADVSSFIYKRLTVFVDHFAESSDRPENDSTDVYVDNIGVPGSYIASVKEFAGAEMMLYPNPAEFRLAVQYPGMNGITLTDVMGRQVKTFRFGTTHSKVVNVGDLTPGIYFVTAESVYGNYTMRLLKK
jgi:hypothetical protein